MKKTIIVMIAIGLVVPLICFAKQKTLSSIKLFPDSFDSFKLFKSHTLPLHVEIIRVSAGGSPASRNLEDVHLELKTKAIKYHGDAVKNVRCDEYQGHAGIFYKCEGDVIMYQPGKDASKEEQEEWERLTEKHIIHVDE